MKISTSTQLGLRLFDPQKLSNVASYIAFMTLSKGGVLFEDIDLDVYEEYRSPISLIKSDVLECSKLIKIDDVPKTIEEFPFFKTLACEDRLLLIDSKSCICYMNTPKLFVAHYLCEDEELSNELIVNKSTGFINIDNTDSSESLIAMLQLLTFINIGEINRYTLKGGKESTKNKLSKSYVTNKTNQPITVIGTKWNDIIKRTNEFGVRGHFRMQPCGVGFVDRKLTWVKAHVRKGYTYKGGGVVIQENADNG